MSAHKRFVKKGFTLVEILIVVVILGILAAIVIPQFTSASETAKGSSLVSQLQTIRSQLELYQVQHNGNYPSQTQADFWRQLTTKTDVDGVADANGVGPYLKSPVKNPFLSGDDAIAVGAATSTTAAWAYDATTGNILPILTADQATAAGLSNDLEDQADQFVLRTAAGG